MYPPRKSALSKGRPCGTMIILDASLHSTAAKCRQTHANGGQMSALPISIWLSGRGTKDQHEIVHIGACGTGPQQTFMTRCIRQLAEKVMTVIALQEFEGV